MTQLVLKLLNENIIFLNLSLEVIILSKSTTSFISLKRMIVKKKKKKKKKKALNKIKIHLNDFSFKKWNYSQKP